VRFVLRVPGGSGVQDVHLTYPGGGKADFRGTPGRAYCMLSAANLSVGFEVQEAIYRLRGATVNGTFMTQAHVVAHSSDGYRLRLTYDSTRLNELHYSWNMANATCELLRDGSVPGSTEAADVVRTRRLSIRPKLHATCGRTRIDSDYSSVAITTDEFVTTIVGQPMYGRVVGPLHRIDMRFRMLTTTPQRAPHGLVGQGFVGTPRHGRRDEYPRSGNFTTSAWAEGAIDGSPADYVLASPYSTTFAFSRFSKATPASSDAEGNTSVSPVAIKALDAGAGDEFDGVASELSGAFPAAKDVARRYRRRLARSRNRPSRSQ